MPVPVDTVAFRMPPVYFIASWKLKMLICNWILTAFAPLRKIFQVVVLAVKIIFVVETFLHAALLATDLATKVLFIVQSAKSIEKSPTQGLAAHIAQQFVSFKIVELTKGNQFSSRWQLVRKVFQLANGSAIVACEAVLMVNFAQGFDYLVGYWFLAFWTVVYCVLFG